MTPVSTRLYYYERPTAGKWMHICDNSATLLAKRREFESVRKDFTGTADVDSLTKIFGKAFYLSPIENWKSK